jgi:endonuclease/exonuclease/phosphatase family metal-dependent hydrolase
MNFNILTRWRTVLDQEIQEPTLLVFALTSAVIVLLLVACVVAMAGLPAFGGIWWTFAAVAVLLLCLVLGLRHRSASTPMTTRLYWFQRILRWARFLFIGVLACWLGLIVWLEACPGGPAPPAKAEPDLIRVVNWNIHCGQDSGLPWQQFDWPGRKLALRSALDQARPDILCVQEATPPQLAFLETVLPEHHRVGIGRDGEAGGEHCAIFFRRQRFEEIAGSTFWLEEPTDQPRAGSALDVKRICTWVRLRDRVSGRTLRVYNTHLYLTEAPRLTAARIILSHIAAGDPTDAVLLAADFNASPAVPSRRLFLDAGLADSAEVAGKRAGRPTFQLYGIGLWSIDGILVDRHFRVCAHLVLKMKSRNTFPSDHFAVLADLAVAE